MIDYKDTETLAFMKGLLNEGDVRVVFTKKDGTERTMLCTLREEKIPAEFKPKTEATNFTDEAMRVFDLEANGWRSFRWDSVKKFEFSL